MTKKEIQQIMAIVRPAIIALYGRQAFNLIAYTDRLAYQGKPGKSMLLEIEGQRFNKIYREWELVNIYKVEVENGVVSHVSVKDDEK